MAASDQLSAVSEIKTSRKIEVDNLAAEARGAVPL
jgi:hypothetical protein